MKVTKDYYLLNDKKYDRITAVLDYFITQDLMKWIKGKGLEEAKKQQKTAKQIGTRVDGLIKKSLLTNRFAITPHDPPSVLNCLEGYKNWYSIEKPKIIGTDITAYDDGLGIAGTLDIELDDTIVDIKCAEAIYPVHWLQVAMYSHMGMKEQKLGILRLDKFTADYEYKVIAYNPKLVHCYLGVLNYYRYLTTYKLKEKEGESNGEDRTAHTEIEAKLGIFSPEVSNDRSEWYREV